MRLARWFGMSLWLSAASACSAAAAPASTDSSARDDAGTPLPPPTCALDNWKLASSLRLSQAVDYIADRDTRGPLTFSERGRACSGASAHDACTASLALAMLPHTFGRHLATTRGDDVTFWRLDDARELLGDIDTPAEVWWLLMSADRYHVPCSAMLEASGDAFIAHGVMRGTDACPLNLTQVVASVMIARTGELTELTADAIAGASCPVPGDRP